MSWQDETSMLSPAQERQFWLDEIQRRTDAGYGMAVNCKHMPSLDKTPQLRKLIESGLVVRRRDYRGRNSSRTILTTPIVPEI